MSEESISERRERSFREFLGAVRNSLELQSKLHKAEDPGDVVIIARSFGYYGFRPEDVLVDGKACILRAQSKVADETAKSIDPHAAVLTVDSANSAVTPEGEPLDAAYIANYGIEDFNTALLSNPLSIRGNKFLSEVEQKDRTMPMLCPAAKALYFLKRPELRDYLRAGLDNLVITDPRNVAQPSREEVVHVVAKSLGDKKIMLQFRSSAEFIWAEDDSGCDDWSENGLQIGSLRDWKADSRTGSIKDELLAWLKQVSNEHYAAPLGDPVDDGPFVCNLRYRLSSINGVPIKSQAQILSSTHDLQFVNCSHAKQADAPCNAGTDFSWTILLGKDDLRNVLDQEEWLRNQVREATDGGEISDVLKISVDEIYESYKAGEVMRNSVGHLYLLIGSGSEWQPGFESDTEDEVGVDSRLSDIRYPVTHPPLFAYKIVLDGKSQGEDELNECLGVIGPLIQAAIDIA